MLTSSLKIINEDIDYVSPTQKFQFAFPPKKYDQEQILGGTRNNDLSHITGKLTYSSQKYENHISTAIAPEKNVPEDANLVKSVEEKGTSTSAFRKR